MPTRNNYANGIIEILSLVVLVDGGSLTPEEGLVRLDKIGDKYAKTNND